MQIAQRVAGGLKDSPALADAFAVQVNEADVEHILILIGVPVEGEGLQDVLGLLIGLRL